MFLRRVVVSGRSMEPTLREGQRLLVSGFLFRRPRRGDVVVVQHPRLSIRVVKRLVALPGDPWEGRALGADEFAVRGDNPAESTDSAHWGPVPRRSLLGRVVASSLGYSPRRPAEVRHSSRSTISAHGSHR